MMNKTLIFYICALTFILINYFIEFISYHLKNEFIFSNTIYVFLILLLSVSGIWFIFKLNVKSFQPKGRSASFYAAITLLPLVLLLQTNVKGNFLLPMGFGIVTCLVFFLMLKYQKIFTANYPRLEKAVMVIFTLLYFIIIVFKVTQQYHAHSMFNPKDYFIYNEAFQNTLKGEFFRSSVYGSLFACHNTWFYIFLLPFYYFFPHPLTLMVIKTLLLSLSIIPLFLIVRIHVKGLARIVLLCAFMLYPYILYLNFSPPHEISYLPFFLLFAIYYFKQNAFKPFMIFLIMSLLIKEHVALIAVIFGVYAFFRKKEGKWIAFPIICGCLWAVFSIAILTYFKNVYSSYDIGSWVMHDVLNRYVHSGSNFFEGMHNGLSTSNISNIHILRKAAIDLLSPLGGLAPLLSPVSLLGLPELLINLICDRPAMLSAVRHYNVIVACFLLVGTVEGLHKLSKLSLIKKFEINPDLILLLYATLMLSVTLLHLL